MEYGTNAVPHAGTSCHRKFEHPKMHAILRGALCLTRHTSTIRVMSGASASVFASLVEVAGELTEVHQIGSADSPLHVVIIPGNPGIPTTPSPHPHNGSESNMSTGSATSHALLSSATAHGKPQIPSKFRLQERKCGLAND